MKKYILVLGVTTLTIMSCKKESTHEKIVNENSIKEESVKSTIINKNGIVDSITTTTIIEKNNGEEKQEYTYSYVAEDGSKANVTFTNTDDENFISIILRDNTIRLKQKEAWAKGAVYEENGIVVKSEGDNITITKENEVIRLKKAKGQ